MAKFREWIGFATQLLCSLCLVCLLPACSSQELNPTLTSTESTVTLEWNVEANATFYQVTWHRSIGFFFIDEFYSEPFPADGKLVYRTVGLLPGVSYTFLLFRNGNHSSDRVFIGDATTIPLPPENLEVLDRTSDSVLLTWAPGYNSSQSHYEVEYQADGFIQTEIANLTSDPLTFNLTGLMPGHTYLLSMRAVSGNKRSNSSVAVTAVTAPAMPENVNVTATGTSTLLATWDAGNNSLQDSFEVVYSLAGDTARSNTTCAVPPCEFPVNGVPGQLYTIYVYAVQQTFRSEPAVVEHNTAPAPPKNLNGVGGVRSLDLTWEVPSQGVFESFRVILTNFDNTMMPYDVPKSADDTLYKYSPTGLTGGVNFFVRVYSVTATEISKDSASHLYFTLPESVSSLSGQALNITAVQLSWQNPFNSQYSAVELNVTRSAEVEMTFSLTPGDATFTVGSLDPGVEYVAIMVVKSIVQVDSAAVNVTIRTKPEAPLLVSASPMEESIAVTLTGGQNPNGVYDSIMAQLQEDGKLLAADGAGLIDFSGLTPGTEYTLDAYTMSGNQNSVSFVQVLYTKPRPPQNVTIEVVTPKELTIHWAAPDSGGVDNYTVTIVPSHGAEVPTVAVTSNMSYSFTRAQPGETYNVSVVANKGTESSVPVMEQNTTPPLPLEHVRVSMRGVDFATISWDTPSGSVFDGFAYNFTFLNKTLEELGPEPQKVKLEPLAPDSNYTVTLYVFSRRVDGTILYSEPTAFNFSTYPESVAALQKVDATSDSITVNWTAPVSGNFSHYQLGINPADSQSSIIEVNKDQTEQTFTGLMAGKNYTIAIRTVLALNRFGIPVRLRALTSPLPVLDLAVETLSASSVRLSWSVDNLNSTQNHFTVVQDKDGVRKTRQVDAVEDQAQYEVVKDQLLAGHTYTFTVTATREIDTDIEESLPEVVTGTTKPLPVENVTVTENDQIVTITWAPAAGSVQETYKVQYRPTLRNATAPWSNQTASNTAVQFSYAFPGERYEVWVIAVSKGQESDPSLATIIVAPLPPTVSIDRGATTTRSVTLMWTHDPAVTYVDHWLLTYRDSQMTQNLNISVDPSSNNYTQVLTPLTSGVTYVVEVMAVVQEVMSKKMVLNTTAKPTINTNIVEIPSQTTNSELAFEYRVTASDVFDAFRFTLEGVTGQDPVEKTKEDRDHQVKFTGLEAGTVYTIQAVTVSAGEVSDPVTETILTVPNNVNVNFQNKSDEIVVNLVSLEGGSTKYKVSCLTPSAASCWDEEVAADTTTVTINNLQPYTVYSISVTTIAGGVDVAEKSVEKSYEVRTLEAAPGEVRQVTATEDGLRTVQLSWQPPLTLNGELRSYRLVYTGTHPAGSQDSNEEAGLPPTVTSRTLKDLKAGYTYVFQVEAMTVALGPAGEASITLSTDVPTFKLGNTPENSKPTTPTGGVVSETALSVELVNAFSDNNGPILGYVVIVSTDPTAASTQEVLPSWSEARNDRSISIYQATDKCPDMFFENSACGKSTRRSIRAAGGQDTMMFQLGTQTAEECKRLAFCNGPLNAETDYYVKLRAFTESGYADTEYSSKIRTADAPASSSVLIGAVVAVVVSLLIIAVVVIVVVIRIKRRPKRATKYRGTQNTTRTSWDTASLKNFRESTIRRFREVRDRMGVFAMHLLHINSTQSEENTSIIFDRQFYRTLGCHVSRPVKVQEFSEHVRKMAADSDFKYAEEYEDLKEVGRDQTCFAAELPVNRPKNRFTNILPYDHSRVKLLPTDDEDGSDYINANYMPGFLSKREYIATQGPLPATRDDFWRMVWEQNARNIVMLTRCMEKGREKSDHYWPADSEPKFYGDLQVSILNETHLPDWTITEFRMCLGDNCRQIRHFHYKAWPDFGVPKNHSSLIRFARTVRDKLLKDGGPIITHCSAGVGRSGTFIVLDHCLQLIREKDEVDIFSIVYSLRRERVLMVQTEQQYKFVHECLACVLEGREDEATYANLGQVNVGFEDDEGINVEIPS